MHLVESLYIHFPFCKHLCNYCDFYKAIPQDFGQDLLNFHQLFEREWTEHQKLMLEEKVQMKSLKTLYIGGGTPSLWKEEGALFLKNFLQQNQLDFDPEYEFTMEVNPATWTDQGLSAWRESGVNRFSIGVQSYREDFLKILDRVHDLSEVKKTLQYFSNIGVNYSIDLMLGLPHSEELKRDVIEELKALLNYGPSHFSVYILTVKPQYKHYSHLPSESYIENEYLKVAEFLKSYGFVHYEVSNYALPQKESQHNLQYWKGASVAAIGPSATGFFHQENQALRYKWKTTDHAFERERLTEKELKFEQIYLGLRTTLGLKESNLSVQNVAVCDAWISRKLATKSEGFYRLNSNGYLLLDSLILELN
ncbi:MAG: coproporphyrinogen-III oxidase family protein [Bacteriovoracaceae bacterium]